MGELKVSSKFSKRHGYDQYRVEFLMTNSAESPDETHIIIGSVEYDQIPPNHDNEWIVARDIMKLKLRNKFAPKKELNTNKKKAYLILFTDGSYDVVDSRKNIPNNSKPIKMREGNTFSEAIDNLIDAILK